jgi:DnaA family protein
LRADVRAAPMKQVPLALQPDPQQDFEGFVPVGNEALLGALRAPGRMRVPLYLWGPPGCGKSRLLRAFLGQARARGMPTVLFEPAGEGSDSHAIDPAAAALVVDDVHTLDPAAQHRLFAALVEAQGQGLAWLVAGNAPPVDLPLREDLRTRLGWGTVYAVQPLADLHARSVLRHEAARRGFTLGDEVTDYLLHRFSRDLPSLMRLLDELDSYALARKRAVTVPLLREMLAEAGT